MGQLTKVTVLEKMEISSDGSISLRFDTYVTEDGVPISAPQYHRVSFGPDVPLPESVPVAPGVMGLMPLQVKAVVDVVWTPTLVEAYREKKAAQLARAAVAAASPETLALAAWVR